MWKALLAAFAALALVGGCKSTATSSKDDKNATASHAVRELSVADAATALKDKRAIAVDANDAETRQKYGVVPGAVLLTGHKTYALSELPSAKDQKLVFYCGGTQCRASDAAASRALSAGYADVNIMRAGIRGWVAAGQRTSTLPKS